MTDEASLTLAVDGPGGVGKTTASRELARRLGIPYLSTGLMYRAVGLRALAEDTDLDDEAAVEDLLVDLDLRVDLRVGEPVLLVDGVVQGDELKSSEAAHMASKVAVLPAVRRFLVTRQQQLASRFGGVIEGRDIGTKVLPEAPYKFFLDASLEVRARRRARELEERGENVDLDTLIEQLAVRDEGDRSRADSPLTYDDSYVVINTSEMTVEEVVEKMLGEVQSRS